MLEMSLLATHQVLRQAKYESSLKEHLADDMIERRSSDSEGCTVSLLEERPYLWLRPVRGPVSTLYNLLCSRTGGDVHKRLFTKTIPA